MRLEGLSWRHLWLAPLVVVFMLVWALKERSHMPTEREIAVTVLVVLSALAIALVSFAMYIFGIPETLYSIVGIEIYAATIYSMAQWAKKRFYQAKDEEEDHEGSKGWGFILRMMVWQLLYALAFKYFVPGSTKELMNQWLNHKLGSRLVSAVIVNGVDPSAYTGTLPAGFPLHQAHVDLLVYFLLPQLAIIVLAFITMKMPRRL